MSGPRWPKLARFTVEQIREAIAFFDCDELRRSYTGFLVELRAELRRR